MPAKFLALAALSIALAACDRDGGSNAACDFGPTDRYPAKVVDSSVGGPDNTNTNASTAEGAPDCGQKEKPDLSLGGGYVVFDLGCQLTTGPGAEIKVWESDESYCNAISEAYIAKASSDGESYIVLGDGFGVTEFDVTGLQEFRFVRVEDSRDVLGGPTPGPDIDALEILRLSSP